MKTTQQKSISNRFLLSLRDDVNKLFYIEGASERVSEKKAAPSHRIIYISFVWR